MLLQRTARRLGQGHGHPHALQVLTDHRGPLLGRVGGQERGDGRGQLAVGDAAETYDLTNIGTLFAFALVCAGVLVLRVREPQRPRPFRVPCVWIVAPLGVAACLFIMLGLPRQAWLRFGWWLGAGLVVYVLYGYRRSRLRLPTLR